MLQARHGSAQFANLASGDPEANPEGHGASYCSVSNHWEKLRYFMSVTAKDVLMHLKHLTITQLH